MTTVAAPAGLWITGNRLGRRRLLTARGRIDHETAPRLAWVFARARSDEPVALDLRAAEVADGPGTVLLLNTMRRLHARQRELIVVCEQASLRRALDSSGLARRFELLRDSDAAADLPMPPPVGHGAAAGLGGRRLRASTAAHRVVLLADATLAIEERHGEAGLGLHDIARDVATSDRQLQRVFSELAGSAFRDELAAVRMQHGAALLQTTDLTVVEISRRVGYRQPAQFAKAFRRHHGVPPTGFRHTASRRDLVGAGPGRGPLAPGPPQSAVG